MKENPVNDKCTLDNRVVNKVHPWPSNTTLITGSSLLTGVEESRLSKYKAKVRVFPGAFIDDMYDYIMPLLRKSPSNIILHIGSNDAPFKSSEDIISEMINLEGFIKRVLPMAKIYISCPVIRTDNVKANNVLRQVNKTLKSFSNVVNNDNVDSTCVGRKGLHLNVKGSGRLAMNYISLMRCL